MFFPDIFSSDGGEIGQTRKTLKTTKKSEKQESYSSADHQTLDLSISAADKLRAERESRLAKVRAHTRAREEMKEAQEQEKMLLSSPRRRQNFLSRRNQLQDQQENKYLIFEYFGFKCFNLQGQEQRRARIQARNRSLSPAKRTGLRR